MIYIRGPERRFFPTCLSGNRFDPPFLVISGKRSKRPELIMTIDISGGGLFMWSRGHVKGTL